MKKESETSPDPDDMQPEYDFTGLKGVRGKYYRSYRQGHKVSIHEADGSTSVHFFQLRDGAVMLEPDVRKHFPDSDAVNNALRGLILAPSGQVG